MRNRGYNGRELTGRRLEIGDRGRRLEMAGDDDIRYSTVQYSRVREIAG